MQLINVLFASVNFAIALEQLQKINKNKNNLIAFNNYKINVRSKQYDYILMYRQKHLDLLDTGQISHCKRCQQSFRTLVRARVYGIVSRYCEFTTVTERIHLFHLHLLSTLMPLSSYSLPRIAKFFFSERKPRIDSFERYIY